MKNKEVEVKFGQDIIMTFIQSNSKFTIRTFYTKSNVTIENKLLDTEIFSLVEEMVLVLSYFINNYRIYTTITINNNNTISCKIDDINNITSYQHTVEISKELEEMFEEIKTINNIGVTNIHKDSNSVAELSVGIFPSPTFNINDEKIKKELYGFKDRFKVSCTIYLNPLIISHNIFKLKEFKCIKNHNSSIPIYYTLNRVSQKSIVLNKRIVKAKIKIKK